MPKDKPNNPESEGFRPLPKPIKLDLPSERPKPQRRLHETEENDRIPRDSDYSHEQDSRQRPVKEEPEKRRRPSKEEPDPRRSKPNNEPEKPQKKGNRYFKSAQKAYGQRRRQPKPPPKQKQQPKSHSSSKPRLGQGDRLYTPPQIREPLISPKVKRVLKFWALGLVGVAFIVLVLMSMFRNNAWSVYLDDRFVGYMPINREVETDSVHYEAVRHLSESLGASIQVNEKTIVRESRARRGELIAAPAMILELSQRFTYQIVGAAIYIDNERVAILRNETEADHVKSELMRPFINQENHVSAEFEENWQIRPALADLDSLDSPTDVIQLLERPIRHVHTHTIRDGDTQGALAIEFNTTLDSIGYLNNITTDAILRTGNTILLEITRPRLTVRTINEISIIEDVPMEVETRENANLHISVTNVITEGLEGQREVVQRITSINGIPTGVPEIVSSRILRQPTTRVIEVGTSEEIIQIR